MKLTVMLLLAVVTAASNITAASDTLRVRSYRIINTCSNEQRWLIDAYIGEVFASDSLQSFDITIGYDTSLVTPTDGLSSGTLSAQMPFGEFSPFFNFRIPGEMRVGAFTIDRNAKGDLPLFAVAGNFKGQCPDETFFTLPWEATFNEEFKARVSIFLTDTVLTQAVPVLHDSIGIFIDQRIDTIPGLDSTATIQVIRKNSHLLQSLLVRSTLQIGPLQLFRIVAVVNTGADTIEFNSDSTTVSFIGQANTLTDTFSITVRSLTNSIDTSDIITTSLELLDTCGCVDPRGQDTANVFSSEKPTTSVATAFHESTGITTSITDNEVEIQFLHGQPGTVQIFSSIGEKVSAVTSRQDVVRLSTEQFSKGQYFLVISTECCCERRMFLK
jgi:hypothetical protein